ncbi:MAG: NADH-quinone oxidoreductase subunit NuoG [Deltaproteobacteria bacterium]|nr:MAG: NADH-quinone oxidoreductase subunit NuoG [Deltaproteobacteria bacterium]
MPTLTIDNREITVPEGTNVLEAARALDIVIPHFCYHEALGAVGACRLCAMRITDGKVSGIQMACMVRAKDGMIVSTLDPDAVELRRHVIEWLMTNHPHDCPVCDEGGECQLQEMTIAGGHGNRRYTGKKRTYANQDLGPYIAHEMNRCIACYRCVRTYRDYCGGTDFGVFGSRDRVYFGRVRDGQLESPFAGNLVDVCPTGVFTDKTFRFKSRAWDLQEAPSICPHCSLGCAVVPGARFRELQRIRAGISPEVNGFFICDRGRFAKGSTNDPARPRQPRIDGTPAAMDTAIETLRTRLAAVVARYGPQSVALLGSPHASLEAAVLLRDWAQSLGTTRLVYTAHAEQDRAARITGARLERHARSLNDIRGSDLVVMVGADPLAEGPLLALAARQAVRGGGQVAVIAPQPVELPCRASQLILPTEQLDAALHCLAGGAATTLDATARQQLEALREQLAGAQRPVLVGSSARLGGRGVNTLFDTAEALTTPERTIGVMMLLQGPNSYGGAMLAGRGPNFDMLLDGIEDGRIRALVCLESDPIGESRDPARTQELLGRLDLLAALDARPTATVARAAIFLPTRTGIEADGSYVSNEGRLQAFARVMEPGVPLRDTSPAGHPPREFFTETPGSEPWPAWRVFARLLGRSEDLAVLRREIADLDPRFAPLAGIRPEAPGSRLTTTPGLPHYQLDREARE